MARLREPFLLMVGYGRAGELLARRFDALGQQLVVIDESSDRVDALDLGSYHADIPGLAADAANPHHLSAAGLEHPSCAGVLALTNDDETNLAVTMTAALLRPDLPVVSRTVSAPIAERMRAFGTPAVVNPSTDSASICGSRCTRRRPTSCSPGLRPARARNCPSAAIHPPTADG